MRFGRKGSPRQVRCRHAPAIQVADREPQTTNGSAPLALCSPYRHEFVLKANPVLWTCARPSRPAEERFDKIIFLVQLRLTALQADVVEALHIAVDPKESTQGIAFKGFRCCKGHVQSVENDPEVSPSAENA